MKHSSTRPDSAHPASLTDEDILTHCDVIRQRRSGPGGQHRNKVETAIRITHRSSGVVAEASERRSQAANLATAARRLRINLAIELRSVPGRDLSELWQQRCRKGVIQINEDHTDFPTLLAESLDRLAANDWNLSEAANALGCSSSQLIKLLRKEPRGLQRLNAERRERGLSSLK